MAWVVAIFVLLLFAVSASFRKYALGLLGIATAFGLVFYLCQEREKERSLSRIHPHELVFEQLALNPEYSSYKLTGRPTNNSKIFTLQNVKLLIKMKDCTGKNPGECITIGQANTYIFERIPPGQARELDEYVSFDGGVFKPRGTLEWDYSISEVEGAE